MDQTSGVEATHTMANEMEAGLGRTRTEVKQVLDLQVELLGPLVDTACHANFRHNYFAASAGQIILYAIEVAETHHAVGADESVTKNNVVVGRDIRHRYLL